MLFRFEFCEGTGLSFAGWLNGYNCIQRPQNRSGSYELVCIITSHIPSFTAIFFKRLKPKNIPIQPAEWRPWAPDSLMGFVTNWSHR